MPEEQTEPCTSCGSLLEVTGAPLFADRTCPVCNEQIHVRRLFANYELLGVLGQGGQGTVYRATDLNLDRQVALKVLRLDQGSDPAFVKLFEHEAKITASINHPNVVRVYSFGTVDDRVYLAMELVDGGTFDDLMEKLGRVPEARVLQVGIQVAEGLRAGFENGLIHRDVKPGNILFASDGSAKVVDFGLAVFHEQEAAQTGDIWGTPYYLSPERLNRQQEDFRSDIYSLGAALFHAIAGRPPFEAEDASQVALKHLRTLAVSIQSFAPGVSNATAYVINRTLAKNRDERQASYDEFIEQLQFARDEVMARAKGGTAAPKSRVVLEDAGSKQAMNRITLVIFAVLVLGVLVGGFFGVKALMGGGETPGGPATVEAFGAGWGDAKQLLMDAKWKDAEAAFAVLTTKSSRGSKQADWAIVNEALAAQFADGGESAARLLGKLPDSATPLRKFFVETIRPKLANGDVIPVADATHFNLATHEALGVLFLALQDYELGNVETAGPLFSQFTSLTPEPEFAWLSDYKHLAKPFEDQFINFSLAADAWKSARNERELIQAYHALRALPGKLPKDSKLLPRTKALTAEAQKKIDQLRMEKNKGNFAFHAKARASVSNPNEGPEKAVDGDPGSRWSGGGNGEKWLSLDFGAARNISRWVLTTSSITDGKTEANLASFKLQRSDDGAVWTDVDKVDDNRSAIVDRVVAPFTAKQVRILVTKETRKPTEKTARIHELVLGPAADQAKPIYDAAQNAAVRFSTKTDFVGGPVGDVGLFGSAQLGDDGKFTVKGSGGDIWGNADAFHFAWQPVAGDCELVARLASVQPANSPAKFGIMIRSEFARDASHGSVLSFAGSKVQFASRAANGKATTSKDQTGAAVPRWLKLVRKGAVITGYDSAAGKEWSEIGHETIGGFGPVVFVGLVVCSHNNGQLATAQFTDVKLQKLKP